jgi:multidrug resistance efflux pump
LNKDENGTNRQAANANVAEAAASSDGAQTQLNLLQAGAKPEQIQAAEVGVDQAEAAVVEAELAVVQAGAAVAQAEAGVEQAQTALESAQVALERMTLKAPFDGRVGDLSVEVGEVVSPGMPAVTLADFSNWLVETTDLTELDVVSVSVGMPVEVNVDAIPDEVLSGTVIDIATVSTLTRGDVTYVVTIEIDETDLPLRWGMTTFVEIDVG